MTVANDEQYKCLSCTAGNTDQPDEEQRSEKFSVKIALIDEEEMMNAELIDSKIKCDNYQAKYRSVIGLHEKALNDALEAIKVIRQAYHGNVMVRKHCVMVLKKFTVLTSVIKEDESCLQFEEIFTLLALVMARRFLIPEEIERLENLCSKFGAKFPFFSQKKYHKKNT